MKRREFITLIGGAAAWPLAAHAQQQAMPVIGFLSARSPDDSVDALKAFRFGLSERGFVEGQNVTITFRWAEGHYDRLQRLAAELVQDRVAAIAAFGGDPAAHDAKAATKTIPIIFVTGGDPVAAGLVASLNRPDANATGVTFFAAQIGTKLLELLHSMVPKTSVVAVLLNPSGLQAEGQSKVLQDAARSLGVQMGFFNAGTEHDLETALAAIVQSKIGGLIVTADPFFFAQRNIVATWAVRNEIAAISVYREWANAGGLMSYGASLTGAYQQAGVYVARILKGEKPAELPVVQPTKFEFVINLKTAKALRLEVPPTVLALADEVIE